MMDDNEVSIEENIERLDARVHALRELVASAGWKEYIAILEEQAKYREQNVILVPLPSADAIYAQEFAKGELNALRSSQHLPNYIVEQDIEELKHLRAAREAEESQRNEGDQQ